MHYLTGISDEAGTSLDVQIQATQELGWRPLEARGVAVPGHPKANLHDLAEPAVEAAVARLQGAGPGVCLLGSAL